MASFDLDKLEDVERWEREALEIETILKAKGYKLLSSRIKTEVCQAVALVLSPAVGVIMKTNEHLDIHPRVAYIKYPIVPADNSSIVNTSSPKYRGSKTEELHPNIFLGRTTVRTLLDYKDGQLRTLRSGGKVYRKGEKIELILPSSAGVAYYK